MDPIEQVFAKLKSILRRAAKRTVEALWNAIGLAVAAFPPGECRSYFRNAGYGFT
jgi:transposase